MHIHWKWTDMSRSRGGRERASTADSAPPRRQRQPLTVFEHKRRVARRQPHEEPHEHVETPEDVAEDQDPYIADEAPEDIARDQDPFTGGPYNRSLLTDFEHHVAYQIWQGQERGALKVAAHALKL